MNHYYDKSIFGNYPKTEEELKEVLGRKWRSNILELSKLVWFYRHYPRKVIRAVTCSSNSKRLIEKFGYQKKVNRTIKDALSCGLFTLVSNNYRFNHGDNNIAMRYVINREVMKQVMKLVNIANVSIIGGEEENRVRENKIINVKGIEMSKESIKKIDLAKICISSKKRPDLNMYDDAHLANALACRYPQIEWAQHSLEEINEKFDFKGSNMEIKFEPNIKRGNNCTKFSMRYTSEFMGYPKDERPDWVQSYFDAAIKENTEWFEYDVNASIFRVTYLLNNGVWPDYSGDLYEYWYGEKFESREARKAFKDACNMVYFNKTAKGALKSFLNKYEVSDGSVDEEYFCELKKRIESTIGKSYDSEIFLHESCIYISTLKSMRDLGIRAIPVYDCFYVSKTSDNSITGAKNTFTVYKQYIKDYIKGEAESYWKQFIRNPFDDFGTVPETKGILPDWR